MKAIGVLVAMLVGFAVLALGVYKYDSSHTDENVMAAETAFKSDIDTNLPRGASPADVDKMMDAHGIKAHTYMNFHRQVVGLDIGTGIDAGMQGPFGNIMHECSIGWIFYFDESDRYLSYKDSALCKNSIVSGNHDPGEPMRPGVDEPAPDPYRKNP